MLFSSPKKPIVACENAFSISDLQTLRWKENTSHYWLTCHCVYTVYSVCLAWSWRYWDKSKLVLKLSLILLKRLTRSSSKQKLRFLGNEKKNLLSRHCLHTIHITLLFNLRRINLYLIFSIWYQLVCTAEAFAWYLQRPLRSRSLKSFIDIFSNVLSRSERCEGKQGIRLLTTDQQPCHDPRVPFIYLFTYLSFCHFLGRSRGIWRVPG